MYASLVNKTILITGAGRGIGNALCKSLVQNGTNIIAVVQFTEQATSLKSECPGVTIIVLDLKDWKNTREKLANVPMLDGLVNNAGVGIGKRFEEFNEQDFDASFDVNIKAVFNVSQVLSPKLKKEASVVMVSSVAAIRSLPEHSVYSATKAAVNSLTRSLALEWGARKIRVNSVNPSVVLTPMTADYWSNPKVLEPLLSHIPLHRLCEITEVVDSIAYLLSSKSSFINGHHLNVEGGYSVS